MCVLRRRARPDWLRGKGSARCGAGPYFVRVIKREKLACRKCPEGGVATAPGAGPHIVEKGKLSDALVVDVLDEYSSSCRSIASRPIWREITISSFPAVRLTRP